jgi:hypothetical protein
LRFLHHQSIQLEPCLALCARCVDDHLMFAPQKPNYSRTIRRREIRYPVLSHSGGRKDPKAKALPKSVIRLYHRPLLIAG